MEAMFDKETQQAMDMLDEAIAEVETEVEAEAHPETAAPDLFEGYNSISLAVAEDNMGEQVICWDDSYELAAGMVVTLAEEKAKNLHLIKKCVCYAGSEVGKLLADFLPIFKVEEKWCKA